jgi:hypothetical protein
MAKKTAAPEQHEVKVEKFRRNLLVKLSDREKAELAERAAHLFGEIEMKTEELKSAAKQSKAQVDELKAEHKRVNTEYRDGSKYQEVPCERRYVFRTGMVQEVRTDTGEVMHERAMTDKERQLELPGAQGNASEAKAEGAANDADEPELATAKKKRSRKAKAASEGASAQ